jgi:SAM-dependent methyltransferase
MPALAEPNAEERLHAFWRETRRMEEVLARVPLGSASLAVDVGGGLTTPLRWFPGRRLCIDPLAQHYAQRFALPLDRVTYVCAQGEALPLISASVDLVVCTNCVDHTDDPHKVAREIRRVLRPGGWFWFSCEAHPPSAVRNAGHPHSLDRAAIRELVSGFSVALEWEEPWRGVYRFLTNGGRLPTTEFGFLARKAVESDGR